MVYDKMIFIDSDGNKIFSDDISSHVGLSKLLLEKDKKLKEEFEQSGKRDMTDFLVMDKGYLKVSNIGNFYKVVSFEGSRLTEKQKRLLRYYAEEGYHLDNLSIINKIQEKNEKER